MSEGSTPLSVSLGLPRKFRSENILAFHRRDPAALAERVEGLTLTKGLSWEGHAACLTVRIETGCASAELVVDGDFDDSAPHVLERILRRMLGLTQAVEDFEQAYRHHPEVGALIARQPGLRVPVLATPFEALSWAVTGQQISMAAALSLRRKLIQAVGIRHSSGLACYPEARHIAALSEPVLRAAGFSRTKAQTLIALSRAVTDGRLPLDDWLETLPVDRMREQLLGMHGIGPWTVDYTLLRGFGWLDGSLHGDAAVRRKLQLLLGCSEKIDARATQAWLAGFSPWRALVAAHLWAYKGPDIY